MLYRPRFLITMDGPPLAGGCLRIDGDRVAQIGKPGELEPLPGEPVRDLPDAVLMPGLINAHCHLELGMARGMLPHGEAFPMWVSRLRKALDGAGPERFREAARLGALECLKHGTTTVVDVGNTGEALRELAALPIRSFACLELLGLDPAQAAEKLRLGRERLAALPPSSPRFQPGLTGHAPYSCSVELLRGILDSAARAEPAGAGPVGRGPFTLHVAESGEETAMFRDVRGGLLEYCRRFYPALALPGRESPIRFLHRQGLIPRGALLAHCNYAEGDDLPILAQLGVSVVHCPKSRAFFNHGGFPLGRMRAEGINLCLGTDSLASNDGLNLFDEMAEFKRRHPEIPSREIVAMATVNGAKALGRTGDLGCLRPGSRADFIAFNLRHHPELDLYDEIVGEEHEVALVALEGEEVVS